MEYLIQMGKYESMFRDAAEKAGVTIKHVGCSERIFLIRFVVDTNSMTAEEFNAYLRENHINYMC